jgi:hypothetical protein
MQSVPNPRQREATGMLYGILIVFLTITIQFGYSVYASIQFGAFAILFVALFPGLIINARALMVPLLISVFCFYCSSLVYMDSSNASHNLLAAGREFLCFLAVVAARQMSINRVPQLPDFAFWTGLVLVYLMTFAQFFYLQGVISHNTLLPDSLFAFETGTISEGYSDVAIAGGWQNIIRPSAFYSEPSYLGFICLCLYMLRHRDGAVRNNLTAFVLLLVLCLMARTASGVILLSTLVYGANIRFVATKMRYYLGVAIIFGLVIYFGLPYFTRTLQSTDVANEESGYIRLIFPLKCIKAVLLHEPLGVPRPELPAFLREYLAEEATNASYDNGIANAFIFHGVFGLGIFACLIFMLRNGLLILFVLLCGFPNGALFGFDKAVMISLVILAYMQTKRKSAAGPGPRRMGQKPARTLS